MEQREFGRTGLKISVLGFGCGSVGGLMVRGNPADQEKAVARALDAGVNYFDTAVQYGTRVRPMYSRMQRQWAQLTAVLQENITGVRVVKAFAREPFEVDKFSAENQEYLQRNIAATRLQALVYPMMVFISSVYVPGVTPAKSNRPSGWTSIGDNVVMADASGVSPIGTNRNDPALILDSGNPTIWPETRTALTVAAVISIPALVSPFSTPTRSARDASCVLG